MEQEIRSCPVCGNLTPDISKCIYQGQIMAYNVICRDCGFTGRSFKRRYKAIKRWGLMCEQVKTMRKPTDRTLFICQLPSDTQALIKSLIESVDGADVDTAMSGRLCDLEDNIDLDKYGL